jgi:hypothetical protein
VYGDSWKPPQPAHDVAGRQGRPARSRHRHSARDRTAQLSAAGRSGLDQVRHSRAITSGLHQQRRSEPKDHCRPAGNGHRAIADPRPEEVGRTEGGIVKTIRRFHRSASQTRFVEGNDLGVACKSANLWTGSWDSDPRHPAWKSVICSYLQRGAVSAATFRLCQVSPNQVRPALTFEIEVHFRSLRVSLCVAPLAVDNKGSRCHASLQPIG